MQVKMVCFVVIKNVRVGFVAWISVDLFKFFIKEKKYLLLFGELEYSYYLEKIIMVNNVEGFV